MRLHTLGGLRLEGTGLQRPKPLVLLAYLCLEGSKPRRFLAELFWPDASDPMNSLAVALGQIRKAAPGAASADESRAWTNLECDALELTEALRATQVESAVSLYAGPFLEGAENAGLSLELEEWVFARREALAAQVRDALIEHAEREAGLGRFAEAAHHAETAFRMSRTAEPDPEQWVRLHPLLVAGNSPLAQTVRDEAQGWKAQGLALALETSTEAARGRLRQSFVGREAELERLLGLGAGAWAWVRGGAGAGKTALLRRLEKRGGGTYLPARAGLPFATLEPVLGAALEGGFDGAMLRAVAGREGTWLLDGWEGMDAESRDLLERLRRYGTKARVVIASRDEAALPVDARLELGSIPASALNELPGAFEATGGVPALLDAWLRGAPLETALEARLNGLTDTAREVHGALALLDAPDLPLVRGALGLDAAVFAGALEQLTGAGLIEPNGQVRGRETVLRWLEARPTLEARLALGLARGMDGANALGLYRRARAGWEPADLPRLTRAYRDWALEALRRGFPGRAAEALADAPPELGLTTLRVRALERAGQYREALDGLRDLPSSPETAALRGTLLWRLGRPLEARTAAESALDGDDESRAEALNTLGLLELSSGQYAQALGHFRRSATLWLAAGERERHAGALNNQAVVRAEMGEDAETAFREALEAAGDQPVQRALALLSLGRAHERRGHTDQAETLYREVAAIAEDAGSLASAARAWNNLGALHHRLERLDDARNAYRRALELAQSVGERLLIGTVLVNIAEIDDYQESLEEALRLFEQAGHQAMLEQFRQQRRAG